MSKPSLLSVFFLCVCLSLGVRAQDFPNKAITLVVPYPPGGSNDVFARNVGKELAELLKQPVVIDNKPGASGTTGTAMVSRAPADGYTLVVVSSSMTTNTAIQKGANAFDPVRQLTPVAMLAEGPMLVAVNPDFPAKTPQELISAIKAKPGALNYGSSGPGSINQFGTEQLKAMAGLQLTHVPYRGMNPAVTDLIGGQIQIIMASGPSLLPMIRAGRIRAVGITSPKASAIAPELMPMASAVPGYEFSLWWGLFAPAGMPAAIVQRLNQAINQVLLKPTIKQMFLNEGAEVKPLSAEQFADVLKADIARARAIANKQGIVGE
ncbi:MAG: hypothetical protein RLZZ502_1771 [Pseudomonadota bacterium]|jgi:tripartite-type tricarboxylate transporter receptor subunit TctC